MSAHVNQGPVTGNQAPADRRPTPEDDEMLDDVDDENDSSDEEEQAGPSTRPVTAAPTLAPARPAPVNTSVDPTAHLPSPEAFISLKRQADEQAAQINQLLETIASLTATVLKPNEPKTAAKPRIATPDKYEGGRQELRAFLTNIELYCAYYNAPNDQERILTASMHMKGRATNWMQPYVEDYLRAPEWLGTRTETQNLFSSWSNFKKEIGNIFGEVDAKNQAEKAIYCLRQTKSVSAYTAEFKQLQSKIDWDDAALRTAFENGLKDTIKDGLVHHEKPESLQELIELATRFDNRLWERSQQKGKQPGYVIANTGRQRNYPKKDRDGDVVMVGQVREKSKGKKPWKSDGISKEERQKRYDNKACLRCGEVGHFRKDCEKKTVRQSQVTEMVSMMRQVLKPVEETQESDLSDLELYDEVRKLDIEEYEIIPRVKKGKDIVQPGYETDPVEAQIHSTVVRQRLAAEHCWVCGSTQHLAESCETKQRIGIIGPDAEDTAYEAIQRQPYFEDPSIPARKRDIKKAWNNQVHQSLTWPYCRLGCPPHREQRKESGRNNTDPLHKFIHHTECKMYVCQQHKPVVQQPWEKDDHLMLAWVNCEYPEHCQRHRDRRYATGEWENNPLHPALEATECRAHGCRIHGTPTEEPQVKSEYGTLLDKHARLHYTFCDDEYCPVHYHGGMTGLPQRKPRKARNKISREDAEHLRLPWTQCNRTEGCQTHYQQMLETTNPQIRQYRQNRAGESNNGPRPSKN
jgi:hypothetical protein